MCVFSLLKLWLRARRPGLRTFSSITVKAASEMEGRVSLLLEWGLSLGGWL